jgi:hypothetical protein
MYNADDKDAPCWIIENGDEVQVLARRVLARCVRVQSVTSHSSRYFRFTVTGHATNNHNYRHITSPYSVLPRGHATPHGSMTDSGVLSRERLSEHTLGCSRRFRMSSEGM